MEVKVKEIVISDIALISLESIFIYGIETFSLASASVFIDEINLKIESLAKNYLIHPECRFLSTKNQIYRNIIFGNYLIIYKITPTRIEILNIIHGSRSINFIKQQNKIKI